MTGILPKEVESALRTDRFIHRHVIAVAHALLWVSALSLAAFFHLSPDFSPKEALLFSTLCAYCAYLFESLLATVNVMAQSTLFELQYRKSGLWGWIAVNACVNGALSVLFLYWPHWIVIMAIIFTAGWQKYMDGRLPVRLMDSRIPLTP